MGDQAMATLDDADWSDESHMDECDPGALLDMVAEVSTRRYDDFTHWAFVQKLHLQILPNDREHREGFDTPTTFRIGDPNVHFHAAAAKPYETSGATGKPEWASLFGFILARMSHLRFLSTVYVLVDNRDLTNLDKPEPSLQHWPAVAAWWSNRACMQGPAQERCDVVYFPISQASGLHLVHPTWAGTFVLAALCLVFPGLHIVLLDSDCVPVTLFEVEDVWQEAHRLQPSGFPGSATTSSCAGGLHIMHATNSWLQPGKVNLALGPDCDDSPHSLRVSPLDLGVAPYLAVLFGPQKADQDHPNKTVKQEGSQAPDANQAQDTAICRNRLLWKLSRITLMMSPFWFPVASCYSWFVRLLPRWGMMYIWSIQADVTNQVTSWHCVLALLPSLVVECMFP